MFSSLKPTRKHRYVSITDGSTIPPRMRPFSFDACLRNVPAMPKPSLVLLSLSCIVCVVLLSFIGGRQSVKWQKLPYHALGPVPQPFRYNRTFAEVPSNLTNRAWADIFPRKGGFFNDPAAAPQRATFSVFHQLHCLDGIRHGYWAVYLAAMEGRKLDPAELPMMASPRHIRHCIDLLRQGLMCCADSTVEVKEGDADGVKGFGTTHYCRDWEQLVQWTSDVQARSSVHGG